MFPGIQVGVDHCRLYLRSESQPEINCQDEPLLMADAGATPGIPNGLRSYLLMPILHGGQKLGVLELGSYAPNALGEQHLAQVQAAAPVLGRLLAQDLQQRLAAEQRIRSLEARLARAEQLSALGRLVAGAVHELNNPLTVMQGYAEILQEQPLPPSVIQRLQAIHGQARHAAAIVASLVRLSQSTPRYEEEARPVAQTSAQGAAASSNPGGNAAAALRCARFQKSCDLAEVIHETVAACARDLAERGVLVHVQADPSLFVAAEPAEVTLMLTDMLKKTSDAIPPSGRREVFVAARRCGEDAHLSVADTRESASRNRAAVTLPALPDAQHPARSGGSALVVVEEELARALWQETLINQHWTTASVANPAEALHRLAQDHFDVVLIDSCSPLQDGIPLRAEMDRRGWSTPLILVTGDQVDPASRQAIQESGCPWLSKPFRIAELRGVLESTLVPA